MTLKPLEIYKTDGLDKIQNYLNFLKEKNIAKAIEIVH